MEALAQETGLYRANFAAFEEEKLRGEVLWLQKLRREAFSCFLDLGFPTTKVEAWKYTNVRPITQTAWARATGVPVRSVSDSALHPWRIPGAIELVFVNGRFTPKLSSRGTHQHVRIGSLRDALAEQPETVRTWLGKVSACEESAFAELNTAFFEDGAYLEIRAGAIAAQPMHLLFVTADEEQFALSSPRVLLVAGPRSQATIVQSYVGQGGSPSFTNTVTEIVVCDGAIIDHYNVQQESLAGYHVHTILTRQARASNFTSHNIALGAALARTDIHVLFEAQGSECTLNGLFVGTGTQHIDNHTTIDHAHPHCTSRELYKGILDGKSRGVFNGKIIVRPDAQKTDAMQTNKNLLLSKSALVNSTPALQILADDVKCKHGSTIGQLDDNAMFYLRSRGLDEEGARALLTYAFAAEVTGRIKVQPVRTAIESHLGSRLPGAHNVKEAVL